MNKIIQNAIQNLETGEIIKSTGVHDFTTTTFKNGSFVACDGGHEYIRRAGDIASMGVKWIDLSLDDKSSLAEYKDCLVWGTLKGKKRIFVRLKECSTSHLENILKTQPQITDSIVGSIIRSILNDRLEIEAVIL